MNKSNVQSHYVTNDQGKFSIIILFLLIKKILKKLSLDHFAIVTINELENLITTQQNLKN